MIVTNLALHRSTSQLIMQNWCKILFTKKNCIYLVSATGDEAKCCRTLLRLWTWRTVPLGDMSFPRYNLLLYNRSLLLHIRTPPHFPLPTRPRRTSRTPRLHPQRRSSLPPLFQQTLSTPLLKRLRIRRIRSLSPQRLFQGLISLPPHVIFRAISHSARLFQPTNLPPRSVAVPCTWLRLLSTCTWKWTKPFTIYIWCFDA